jgi:chromosome partitioning protein
VEGFAERVVYREFFPRGLTALDGLDEETLGTRPNLSHLTAREEVIALLNALHLPLSENGKRRAAARAEWYSVKDQPLQVHDIIGQIPGLASAQKCRTSPPCGMDSRAACAVSV